MYEATKKENEKLVGLDNQMIQVETDFNNMMQKRDEEKKELEVHYDSLNYAPHLDENQRNEDVK